MTLTKEKAPGQDTNPGNNRLPFDSGKERAMHREINLALKGQHKTAQGGQSTKLQGDIDHLLRLKERFFKNTGEVKYLMRFL